MTMTMTMTMTLTVAGSLCRFLVRAASYSGMS
jgi:hypothetical protein